jgi:hypothetical protein
MDDLFELLFGPLDQKFCDYFLLLSMVGFVLLATLMLSTLGVGLYKRKSIDFYLSALAVAVGYAIFYFQNRLLYTMCKN